MGGLGNAEPSLSAIEEEDITANFKDFAGIFLLKPNFDSIDFAILGIENLTTFVVDIRRFFEAPKHSKTTSGLVFEGFFAFGTFGTCLFRSFSEKFDDLTVKNAFFFIDVDDGFGFFGLIVDCFQYPTK